jgi:hypothetical protein
MAESESVIFSHLIEKFPILRDAPVIRAAFEHARRHLPAYLLNHVARSWVFAVSIAQKAGSAFDDEVVAAAALLHDMALVPVADGPYRFEVNGANAAREFVRGQGFDERRAQLVWDAIALHSTATIALHKETDVALVVRGIGVDFGRPDYSLFAREEMEGIVRSIPRLNMKCEFEKCLCDIAREHPEKTHNNFIREFGERFVSGYKAPSVVDLMMSAPFSE